MAFNWTCGYCNQTATITYANHDVSWKSLNVVGYHSGSVGLQTDIIVCPNTECREISLRVDLTKAIVASNGDMHQSSTIISSFNLLPQSKAKPQPSYIPQEIRENYTEACLILELSPKASATMSRRCLQGMVRDFWKLPSNKYNSLDAELKAIADRVPADSWKAIDTIRNVGNIGAHMEKDVNFVVDVEPREAALLIELIETLFKDWYIEQHNREERYNRLIALGASKKTQKDEAKAASKKATESGEVSAEKSDK